MTKPTLPTGLNRPPKFDPDEAVWARIARAADFDALSVGERDRIRKVANWYLQAACDAEKGIPFHRLATHNTKLLKHVRALQGGLDQHEGADLAKREFLRQYGQQLGQVLNRRFGPSAFEGQELARVMSALSDLDHALGQLGTLFDTPRALGGWTQARCVSYFLMTLGDLYETKSGRKMSLRKDTQDLGVASPFVAFVRAVWQALPGYNRKHASLDAMTKRIEQAQAELAREMSPIEPEIVSRD